ncbi:MAG: glycosyltransferase [Lachnospiraceae bacterium]|nr:glycosyltransferase [Lachnospiraceae bacterium]
MLFSVIIPIYNIKDFLRKCIDSVLSQNFDDYEIVLVDDGSTDGCSAICDEYAQNNSQVRVIHKENGGLVSARNTGIKEAQGEYILYVDGDDWVSQNWMEVISTQIYSAPENPDIVVFGSMGIYADRQSIHIINASEGFYDRHRLETEIFPSLISDRTRYIEDSIILPAPWNKAYKRSLLEEHHCYDEGIRIGEDTAFVFECFLNAQSAVICKEILYNCNRLNPTSILSKDDPERIRKRLRLFQYIQERLSSYGQVIDQQMDCFYASRILYDVISMRKKTSDINRTGSLLKKELRETDIIKYVHINKIPFRARIVMRMLKMGMCRTVLWGLGMVS